MNAKTFGGIQYVCSILEAHKSTVDLTPKAAAPKFLFPTYSTCSKFKSLPFRVGWPPLSQLPLWLKL